MRLDAEFLRSALTVAECPNWRRVEIALAGRSNVGKSSLLNALAGRKNLARTSKTPGCTRCLNYFTVGELLALVDLPGYGYAKMAHSEAEKIALLIEQYLRQRRELKALVLLIDARRGPQKEEFALAQLLQAPSSRVGDCLHLIVVAAKCDKLKRAERGPALRRFEAIGVAPSLCSSLTGEGIDQVRRQILQIVCARSAAASAPEPAKTQAGECS
ncbi:MAG: YihA family ribosome biogenesis GTP-binding protein [Deltaproteobacteria bacterium]|nr:YihA family ribosome biogenesis GTP-binding protein [Deltaproteobacteria bacterium]MBV8453822.1 YihA family ribosome biogenesis GTP-binding protein [Deltaproteobacteria bacterium]